MEMLVTITTVLLFFIGQYYVTRHHLGGFLVWGSSNVLVAVFSIVKGESSMAILFIVYGLANAYSLFIWLEKKDPYRRKEQAR